MYWVDSSLFVLLFKVSIQKWSTAHVKFKRPWSRVGLSVSVCVHCAMCSYLGDRNRGHFDTLLKQHTQDAVLLLQVKHAGPQLHTLLFQVLETPQRGDRWADNCGWRGWFRELHVYRMLILQEQDTMLYSCSRTALQNLVDHVKNLVNRHIKTALSVWKYAAWGV